MTNLVEKFNQDDLDELLSIASVDTGVFAQMFMPDRFCAPFSNLHDQILRVFDSKDRMKAIGAPRGIGKTSIAIAKMAKCICYRQKKFIIFVSNSATSAEIHTENLKRELLGGKEIKDLFGNISATSLDGMDETFSKKAWVTSTGTYVLPRGSGQQIRGLTFGSYRPDLIIIDDLEDTETIDNPDVRLKRKTWFHADLMKATSRLNRDWEVIYIDTLKHEDALLEEMLSSPAWTSIRLELFDDNYKSLAPDFISDEEVMKEVEYHREHGILDVLYREFRCQPISKEDAIFKPEYFQYYDEAKLEARGVETFILVDPAKTVKIHADESAILAVGVSTKDAKIFVRDIVHGRLYPEQIYDEAIRMAAMYGARAIGCEVTSLHEFISKPFKDAIGKSGKYYEFIELAARGKKEERIRALVPYYRRGQVFHNRMVCAPLESQLLGFPKSKYWDVMDAFAYSIGMMDFGDRYFEPEPLVDDAEIEKKFLELERSQEPAILNWRYA